MFVCVHHVSTSRAHQSAATIAAQFTWAPIEPWVLITACATEYAARAVARNWTPLGMAEDLAELARVASRGRRGHMTTRSARPPVAARN